MNSLKTWLVDNLIPILAMIAMATCVFTMLMGLVRNWDESRERGEAFAAACKEAGGTPVHDGRQMACIK